ncbi:MAG: V-type ATP synthase subunit I, partial [Clostridia bacterium]
IPVEEFHSTRNTVATLATAQKTAFQALLESGELSPLCCVEVISTVREAVYLTVVAHRGAAEETLRKLKEVGYTPLTLSVVGTVSAKLAQLEQELAQIDLRQAAIVKETAAYVGDLKDLKELYDCLASERERWSASQALLGSQSTFYLRGWVPALMTERVEKRIHKVSSAACMAFEDPDDGEEPPVLLHNNAVVSPFESVVSGFSLPTYGGLDPTAVMMPFFINFMGMMISDAGYGIVMALLIPILIKVLKPSPGAKRLMWILAGGGVMTILWGALYNTWFGFSPWPSVFDPINQAMPVMAICVVMGAIHLFTGLGVAAYMNVKRGKPGAAIADQLSWFLLVVGLVLMLVLPSVGQWMALAGAGIILVTAGREKSKNPFKRLISGLGALYGMTSWVSDLLSYMRLFGMGLATGVIGMVINQLVGMVFSAGIIGQVLGVALFCGGHLFNAGINILGAYVHSCRLQYIEFFGKFYEDGGKPFQPLSTTNKYCYIQEAPERS